MIVWSMCVWKQRLTFCGTICLLAVQETDDVRRALIAQLCSKIDNDLRNGCDEELQLLRLGSFIIECLSQASPSHEFILDQ